MSFAPSSLLPSFSRSASRVAIVRSADYGRDLDNLLFEALREFDLPIAGKKVLLKPNFVDLDPAGAVNTHPAVVRAAREAFLRLGARSVRVGEGPAHERDTEAIIEAFRLRDFLPSRSDLFVDLNLDEVQPIKLRTRASQLKQLYLPRTVLEADYLVSLPKLKTHRWVGVTLSLKNMLGIVPGCCYGWPKNALHWAGIIPSVLDINSTVRPDFAIVDGIVGMEGNGPLQGSPKASGVLILGDDPVAVDATGARVMGLVPERIEYLAKAGSLLGNVQTEKIRQLGERVESVKIPFAVPPAFQHCVAAEGPRGQFEAGQAC